MGTVQKKPMDKRPALLLSVLSVLAPVFAFTAAGLAQATGTQTPYTIAIAVDATEAPRKLFHAREVIPVSPGPLTLYYPKWNSGRAWADRSDHQPVGADVHRERKNTLVAARPR